MFSEKKLRIKDKTFKKDFSLILLLGITSFIFNLLNFKISGIPFVLSDFNAVPLIIGIFYVSKPYSLIFMTLIGALGIIFTDSFLPFFIGHSVSLIIIWYSFLYLKTQKLSIVNNIIIWVLFCGIYYFLIFVLVSNFINYEFIVDLDYNFYDLYKKTISSSIRFKFFNSTLISSLYFIYFLTNSELKSHKDEFEINVNKRTEKLSLQKDNIEYIHKNVTDSINYARRIQVAMLPSDKIITECFQDNLIFYKPKEIVSGDFYWIKKIKDNIIIVGADCTGHGVPGALLSMLGISLLNEIVKQNEITTASEILEKMRENIKESMRQNESEINQKDGMDMAICIINKNKCELQYAGAYMPLYIFVDNFEENKSRIKSWSKNNEIKLHSDLKSDKLLFEIKANRQPVSIFPIEKPFENHVITIKENDNIYLFSDGYKDQLGGKNIKRFKIKNFRKLLSKIQKYNMSEQKQKLSDVFENWNVDNFQTDDILVLGVKI